MTRRSPQTVALLDQADAAGRDGAGVLAVLAELLGGTVARSAPVGPVAEIQGRCVHRLVHRQLTTCPHLTGAPEPLWWLAWRPGRLRCAVCAQRAAEALRGRREDRRCDACRRVRSAIHPGACQFPPFVIDLPGVVAAFGPITLVYGLCPDCQAAPRPATTNDQERTP